MKKKNMFLAMLATFIALLGAGTSVASAATLNNEISFYGFGIGILFLGIAALMILIPILMKKKTILKAPVFVIFVVIFGVIGLVSFADIPDSVFAPTAGIITPDVTWKVTTTATGNSTRINDVAKTITVTVDVNVTSGAVYYKGGKTTFVTPTIQFACRPDPSSGSITDLTQGATMQATASDPGKVIYYGGTDYSLISRNTDGSKALLAWVYDGSTEYESRLITIQFGSTGTVNLTIDWNEAGVSKMSAGDSKTIPVSIAGENWIVQLFVSTVNT
ncbi:MAG: hypothetical protein IMZ64_06240 [Bacteroidetes bacterium]|nr:hypothetical protein [Bacteroidota bacterium]